MSASRIQRPGLVLVVAATAQALGVGSASVVGVALPSIADDLGASSTAQQWIVDAYVLVFAALLVTGGVLGDRYGRREAFLLGLGLFGAGSLLCALAPSTGVLVGGRVLQGLGSPILLPAGLGLVTAAYPEPVARARAIGLWSVGSGMGLTLGPVVGGVLSDLSWQWVFGFNVPCCVALAAVARVVVPRTAPGRTSARFDGPGALGTIVAVGALVFAIIEGRTLGWGSPAILGTFALAAAAGAAWVAWERRRADPLVDVGLFARPAFAAACVTALIANFALIGVTIFFATFFQDVQGYSALQSGLCVLPLGLGVALGAPVAGRLAGRTGPRTGLLGGLALTSLSLVVLLGVDEGTGAAGICAALGIAGLGAGLSLPTTSVVVVAAVEPARAGMAVAINNAMRQTGQALGVAVLGTLIFAHPEGFVPGLHRALAVCAVLCVATGLVVAALVRQPATRAAPA